MVELGDVANYAEIFGAIVVLGGLGFAILELRRAREQRQELEEQRKREAAFEIFRGLTSREFISGITLLGDLPSGLTRKALEEKYGEDLGVLRWVLYQFENLGTMVDQGMVSMELAMEFYGYSIMNTWKKMRLYIEEIRKTQNKPLFFCFVEKMSNEIEQNMAAREARGA